MIHLFSNAGDVRRPGLWRADGREVDPSLLWITKTIDKLRAAKYDSFDVSRSARGLVGLPVRCS